MTNLSKKAQELAQLPYTTIVFRDRVSEGDGYVYIAFHPELDGCMAQGQTLVEAKDFLDEIRLDYMEHLLEYNLPIPRPNRVTSELVSLARKDELHPIVSSNEAETFFAMPVEK
jgi:predicted RNase H-like HicB family nuclease